MVPIRVQARVARGAALLDDASPSWWNYVDDERNFDMGHERWCVLGQLYGKYRIGLNRLKIRSGYAYGFKAHTERGIRQLDEAWRDVIANRRARFARSDVA